MASLCLVSLLLFRWLALVVMMVVVVVVVVVMAYLTSFVVAGDGVRG